MRIPFLGSDEKEIVWQPLYYEDDRQAPLPPLCGKPAPFATPTIASNAELAKWGLEAWLGLHALRRAGCTECVQCANPSGEVLLEFYAAEAEYEGAGHYVGINWFAEVQYKGPDIARRVPWQGPNNESVEGALGESSTVADYKSKHYCYADGRILSRMGSVAPAPKGETWRDRGALVMPEGIAVHSNVRVTPRMGNVDAILVSWDPEHIYSAPIRELDTATDVALWAYPRGFTVSMPNIWYQEHPAPPSG